jgi:peptide-methionine (S)-S-oxide reductase
MAILFFGAGGARSGYAADVPLPKTDIPTTQTSETRALVIGGGCFWCTEAVFEELAGVSDVVSGYAGDTEAKAKYDLVCSGNTNHAEVIKVTYDASKISYGQLLRVFFSAHDPTTKDRQGPDSGRQYRSVIFYENDEHKRVAEAYIKQLNEAKVFGDPIVTTLEPLTAFYMAEEYHQNFCRLNPNHPYIRQQAVPKVQKVREKFKNELKPEK